MPAPDPQLARSAVLRLFNHNQIYLLLGAAITTIGLLAAFFALLRRRRADSLLLWFALFAILYGVRVDLNYQLIRALHVDAPLFTRIRAAVGFLVPVPAFFFFRRLDLIGRITSLLAVVIAPISVSLALLALIVGPRDAFSHLNNYVITAALLLIVLGLLRAGRAASPDATLIRRALLVFTVCALVSNISDFFTDIYDIEPFSLLILLAALGIVAARRTFATEQQLTELNRELEIARDIQLSILPAAFPESQVFHVAARYLPMTAVAGDFYDFFLLGPHAAGLLIADVSGHGVPAALIASMVKLAAASGRDHAADPARLLSGINHALLGNTQSQFVTAGYVYLDAAARELRYAAAAHPPLLLLRDGEVTAITENGLMLAAFDFAAYTTLTRPLHPGDRLVLYTDGLLEAASPHGEEFGPERLAALVCATATLPPSVAVDRIVTAVGQWAAAQNDDLTVVLCDFTA